MTLVSLFLRGSRPLLVLAIVCGVLAGAAGGLFMATVNTTLSGEGPTNAATLKLLGLICAFAVGQLVSMQSIIRLSSRLVHDLRLKIARQIIDTPVAQLEAIGKPKLFAILTEDLTMILIAAPRVSSLWLNMIAAAFGLIYLGTLSIQLVVFAAVLASTQVVAYVRFRQRIGDRVAAARQRQDELFTQVNALLLGSKELKLNWERKADFFGKSLDTSSHDWHERNAAAASVTTASWIVMDFLTRLLVVGMVVFVPKLFPSLPLSVRIGGILIVLFLLGPISGVMEAVLPIQKANHVLRMIQSLDLLLPSSERTSPIPPTQPNSLGRIELVGVTHAYHSDRGEQFLLGPISLELRAGELVYLVGGNGSGKSTLAKLLTGLYVPAAGTITVDGKVIDDSTRDWYRQHFSTVFADYHLFSRLVSSQAVDLDARARGYLSKLQLDHKVRVEDGKLSTVDLSQGQRKRLALLTAYLEDRPVYVFDEWASDQDPVFKKLFYTELLPELRSKGKCVFVITHDDHYFHLADRIVRLEYGRIEYDHRPSSDPLADRGHGAIAGPSMLDLVSQELARAMRDGQPMSVVLVRISSHAARVGLGAADPARVLAQVEVAFRGKLRHPVVRHGEMIGVIMPETPRDVADRLVREIAADLSGQILVEGKPVGVELMIGIGTCSGEPMDVTQLLRLAETTLAPLGAAASRTTLS